MGTKNPLKNSPTLGPLALQLLDPNQVKVAKLQEEIKALRNVLSHSSFANTSEYFARCMSITLTSIPSSKPYRILDFEATDHMTANKSLLNNFLSSTIKKGSSVQVASFFQSMVLTKSGLGILAHSIMCPMSLT